MTREPNSMTTNQNHSSRRRTRFALFTALILLLCAAPVAAQYTLAPQAKFTAFDSNGDPIASGKLCTYQAGTTTPATTYQTSAGTVNANPVIMDASGRANVWLAPGQSYLFTLLQPGTTTDCTTGATVWSVDNIGATPASAANLDVLGTAGVAISAGQVVYLSDGSNALTAGQWYLADADFPYASSGAITGIAPNAIVSGAVGTIRLGGVASGVGAVTIGLTYFASNTAGALTATRPLNARAIGIADTTSSLILITAQPTQALPIDTAIDEFRCSLTTAVPVTTADVTAAGTLFFEPYKGNRIALYDANGNATVYTSPEISVAVPAPVSQMYDVWVYANASGAPTLELLAWTNDTTRATAIVNTVAPGVYTKSGDATRRYVCSMRTTTVANQTEDSLAKRYVSNAYNRVPRPMQVTEATGSWTWTTATYQQARATATNQLDYVLGLNEVPVDAHVAAQVSNDNAGVSVGVGIGVDSTTTPSGMPNYLAGPVANYRVNPTAHYAGFPGVGRHTLVWLEVSGAGLGTTTWFGTTAGPPKSVTGIYGTILN